MEKLLKTRTRTKLELENRKKCFIEITKILDSLKIFYFIQGGVLLGAKREKNFIEWDWDVEISLMYKDLHLNFNNIIRELINNNFQITSCNNNKQHIKIDCIKDYSEDVTSYTLLGWHFDLEKKKYLRGDINIPEKYLVKYDKILFLGKEFNAPHPIEDYLTYQYGNWKKRLRSSNKKKYMTKKFYKKKYFIIEKLITFIKKNLNN